MVLLAMCVFVECVSAKTWYVDDEGGADFTRIQDAINEASAGDMIYVYIGIYNETVIVSKTLTLQGEEGNTTIIDASGEDDVVTITASNCVISGFTLKNGGDDGIWMDSSNNRIEKNNIVDNEVGIDITHISYNIKIFDNNILSNQNTGIEIRSSYDITVTNNVISDSSEGILIEYPASNNTVAFNCISNNNNGIMLEESTSNTIVSNEIFNNMEGIDLDASCNNSILNNSIVFNDCGIGLDGPSDCNRILGNNISMNNDKGIILDEEDNDMNMIIGNDIINNGEEGISLSNSSNDNIIYHNNLINNLINAVDESGNNYWDNGYPSGGNYWSDHACTGNPSDGSQPYTIDDSAVDHYPFEGINGWLTTPRKGDLNGDGNITPADAAIALQFTVSGKYNSAADISGDDRVTSLDTLMILQVMAGAISL